MKRCTVCDDEIRTATNTKYCGAECAKIGRSRTRAALRRKRALENLEDRTCAICKKTFRINQASNKKFCGRTCLNRSRYQNYEDGPRVVGAYVGAYYRDEWTVPPHPMSRLESAIMKHTPSQCHKCIHMQTCRQVVQRLQVDPMYNGEIRCMVRI